MRVPAKGVGRPGRDLRQLKRVSPAAGPCPHWPPALGTPCSVRGPAGPALTRLLWLAPKAPHQGWGPPRPRQWGQWVTGG